MYSPGHNSSGYRGVSWHSQMNKWSVYFKHPSLKSAYLGSFDSVIEAARVYDKTAIAVLGLDAVVNFPSSKPKNCWLHIFDMRPIFDKWGTYKPNSYDPKIGKFFFVGVTKTLEGRFTLYSKMGSKPKFIKSLPVSSPKRILSYIEAEFSPITRGFFDTAPDNRHGSPTDDFLIWATGDGIREAA